MHLVGFHLEFASCSVCKVKRKYVTLGMRLLYKSKRNWQLVYFYTLHTITWDVIIKKKTFSTKQSGHSQCVPTRQAQGPWVMWNQPIWFVIKAHGPRKHDKFAWVVGTVLLLRFCFVWNLFIFSILRILTEGKACIYKFYQWIICDPSTKYPVVNNCKLQRSSKNYRSFAHRYYYIACILQWIIFSTHDTQ